MPLWIRAEVQALPREAGLTPNPVPKPESNPVSSPVSNPAVTRNPRLPPFYPITAPLEADGSATPLLEQPACRDWLQHFEALLAGDVELIQLRANVQR